MLLLILPDLSQNQLSVPFPALNAVMVFKLTITELIKIKLTSKQSRVPCVGFQVYYIDSRCAMCPFSATQKCKPAICFHGRCFPGKWHAQGANNPIANTHQNAHMLSYIVYLCLFVPLCILSDPVPISLHISVHTTLQYLRTECQRSLLYKSRRTALSYQVHSTFTAHWSGVASMLIPNPQRDDKGKEQGGIGPIICHAFFA